MNAIAQSKPSGGALVTAEQAEAVRTALKSSLYPGASDSSVDLVLAYCRAAGLDPMQKPVHIVPMWDGKTRQMRDVVMPGIGLYRTNAARTGEYAGMSKPVFGPMVTESLGGRDVTFPEWCEVTAYRRLPSGHIAEFTAQEYWIENYAIKGGKDQDQSPNAMWSKRARGQLAKCAQAQALRMAFPEAVGAAPTAEEMEGKEVIDSTASVVATQPATPQLPPPYPEELFATNLPVWRAAIAAGKKSADEMIAMVETKGRLNEAQKAEIRRVDKPASNPDFPLPDDDANADTPTAEDAE
ncbi:phage recombination protein Bet [Lysobacter enzymogenes]|uniref:phage recombination protein Bet n=1 Tax=Lysobacter enzymogenes TaxID=69 RepID=UPI0019D1E366|nr:phage recombination protein Bet [Lysobacter enzymogenes]MBN7138961.1 phage recombination protein Bet [Lysobacter enzymogenes]